MKKILGIIVLGLLFNNNLLAEEYSNSWKMDIFCKQGKGEWYESAFVVNVENNEFSLGPFKRWQRKNIKFKGKIEGNKIKISESVTFKNGYQDNINYSGEFINDETLLGYINQNHERDEQIKAEHWLAIEEAYPADQWREIVKHVTLESGQRLQASDAHVGYTSRMLAIKALLVVLG